MPISQNYLNYILMHVPWRLGSILYQNQNGVAHFIGYTNRSLSKTECKYLAHKLECLALKWAIMEQFQEYLYGKNFVIHMYNNPLTYIFTSSKLDATGHCWVARLANYNFALSYGSRKMNVDADALSHILRGKHNQHIEADSVHVLISQVAQGTTLTEAYSCNMHGTETLNIQKDPKAMLVEDWTVAQSKDLVIREIKYLISKNKLKGHMVYSWDPQIIKQYLMQHSHSVLHKGVLYG